ncbi:hypothetical protein RQP46_004670 [Phenoliferia psychrophenolica]
MFPSYGFYPRSPSPYSRIPSTPSYSYPTYATHSSPFESDFDFDSYDARRTALEQQALAQRQRERRAAEAAAFHRHPLQHQHQHSQGYGTRRSYEPSIFGFPQRQSDEEEAYAAELARRRALAAREEALRREQLEAQRREQLEAQRIEYERRLAEEANAQAQEQRRRRLAAHAAERERQLRQQRAEEAPYKPHPLQALLQQLFDTSLEPPPPELTDSLAPTPLPSPTRETPSGPTRIEVKGPDSEKPVPKEAATAGTEEVLPESEPTLPEVDHSPENEDAATTLQRRFRAHLARRSALSELEVISTSFEERQSSFVPPASLVFDHSSATIPKLAYASSNHPFLAFEEFLVGLLTKLDAVQSAGDKVVKTARKELVRKVEAELGKLDERKDAEWEKAKAGLEEKSLPTDAKDSSSSAVPVDTDATSTPAPETAPAAESEAPANDSASPSNDTSSPTPLTSAALASVPSSNQRRRAAAASDSGSTTTNSTAAADLGDEFMDEIMKLSGKYGSKSKNSKRPRLVGRDGLLFD